MASTNKVMAIMGKKVKRLLVWLLLVAACLPLAGCWDQRELQNRNMVLAAAIDVVDGNEQKYEQFVQPHGGKDFRLSIQLLEIQPQQGVERGETKVSTYVISGAGRLFVEIIRDLIAQLGKPITWEHVQAIVLSQAAAEAGGMDQLMDWFVRDAEMRWRIRVYITPGEAKPIIEYQPPGGEPNGLFLAGIARNYVKNPHIAGAHTELGFTTIRLDNKASTVLPKIELADGILKVGGMAVIKKGEFAGFLDEHDTLGAKIIMGIEKSAIITTACKEHPDRIFAFELFQHDTRLEPHVSGDIIYYTVDISMYGNIGELEGCPEPCCHNRNDTEYIRSLEVQFAEEVKQAAIHAYKTQQALRVDTLNFGKKLQIRYPEKWAEIKDRWDDEVFPSIPLIISVNVTIRQLGGHK